MPNEKPPLQLCPKCGLPFKTEDNLSLHIASWHSDESAKAQDNHKQKDPVELLWHDLVYRVFETQSGFQGLSEPEKRYFAVRVLDGDVCNGGFYQYFFNSSGNFLAYAILGLEEMGAMQSLALLRSAKLALFDDENILEDISSRREKLRERKLDVSLTLLEEIDKRYWEDPDDLGSKTSAYAKLHRLL